MFGISAAIEISSFDSLTERTHIVVLRTLCFVHEDSGSLQCFPRNRLSASAIGSRTSPIFQNTVSCVSNVSKFLHFFGNRNSVISLSKFFLCIKKIDMDLLSLRSLRQSQALWAHNRWRMCCAGFRNSASFLARLILDGAPMNVLHVVANSFHEIYVFCIHTILSMYLFSFANYALDPFIHLSAT